MASQYWSRVQSSFICNVFKVLKFMWNVQLFTVIDWPSTYTIEEILSSIIESYFYNEMWIGLYFLLVECEVCTSKLSVNRPQSRTACCPTAHAQNEILNSDTNWKAPTSSMTWKDESHDSWSLIDYSGAWRKPFLLAPPQVSCQQSPLHFVLYTNSTNVVFKSYMYPFCWVGRSKYGYINPLTCTKQNPEVLISWYCLPVRKQAGKHPYYPREVWTYWTYLVYPWTNFSSVEFVYAIWKSQSINVKNLFQVIPI